ncbi:MAG: cobalamin-binding protein [Candidatus Methylomirabilales bacterium]
MRVVSLLPSATEIVYLLGLGEQLVGVSHECDYPPAARGKPKIIKSAIASSGSTSREIDTRVRTFLERGEGIYRIDREALEAADPDLILTQELCEVCAAPYREVVAAAATLLRKPEILSLDPQCFDDVLTDVSRVGEATGRLGEAEKVVASLQARIERVTQGAAKAPTRPTVVCLEWLDPVMVSGHWIPEMVALAGGTEVLGNPGAPSRRVAWEQVLSAAPAVLILMPCGFSVERVLGEIHLLTGLPGWAGLPAVRCGRVFAVNGHALYSRSGPRLVEGIEVLAHLVHPELFPGPVPENAVRTVSRYG